MRLFKVYSAQLETFECSFQIESFKMMKKFQGERGSLHLRGRYRYPSSHQGRELRVPLDTRAVNEPLRSSTVTVPREATPRRHSQNSQSIKTWEFKHESRLDT